MVATAVGQHAQHRPIQIWSVWLRRFLVLTRIPCTRFPRNDHACIIVSLIAKEAQGLLSIKLTLSLLVPLKRMMHLDGFIIFVQQW